MRLIVSVSPCPLAFHLSAAFMVSLRARTQSAYLNVCGYYKGSSYIKARKNDRAELWGCAQTHDEGGAVKMRRERQRGEEE